jgi:hypothetical protein
LVKQPNPPQQRIKDMLKKKERYFHLSYQFVDKEDTHGFGCIKVAVVGRVDSGVISGWKSLIEKANNFKSVVILFYKELEE